MPRDLNFSLKLNNICDNSGACKRPKRVGRGPGSGKGKTSGRGHKGQKSRSGAKLGNQNGGQTNLFKQLPKRGMRKGVIRKKNEREVTLKSLCWAFRHGHISPGQIVDHEYLIENGVIKPEQYVVLLGSSSDLSEPLAETVDAIFADRITKGVKNAVDRDNLPVITKRRSRIRKIVSLPIVQDGKKSFLEFSFEVSGLKMRIDLITGQKDFGVKDKSYQADFWSRDQLFFPAKLAFSKVEKNKQASSVELDLKPINNPIVIDFELKHLDEAFYSGTIELE